MKIIKIGIQRNRIPLWLEGEASIEELANIQKLISVVIRNKVSE